MNLGRRRTDIIGIGRGTGGRSLRRLNGGGRFCGEPPRSGTSSGGWRGPGRLEGTGFNDWVAGFRDEAGLGFAAWFRVGGTMGSEKRTGSFGCGSGARLCSGCVGYERIQAER